VIGVTNIEDYDAIRDKMNSVNQEVGDNIIPDIDFFDEQMLIFVFDKVRGTGGYTFKAKHALVNNDTLTLSVISNPPNGPATSIMTQPFQVLKLERLDKKIEIEIIE
jgi:hypothetical protein